MRLFLFALLVLAGCGERVPAPATDATPQPSSAPLDAPPAEAISQPFKFAQTTELIDFAYAYPAEAAELRTLDAELQADLAKVQKEALRFAEEDRAAASDMPRPFHPHYLHKEWTVAGSTAQLLSLVGHVESFTGGAHGNSGFTLKLWDKSADRLVGPEDLFQTNAIGALRGAYCNALDAERLQRRQGEQLEGDFAKCPGDAELVIAPSDGDDDGRFDQLLFLAAPYVAGPYAEGEYEIAVPLTIAFIGRVKDGYRDSFEAQPPQ